MYYESIEHPMPFYSNIPVITDDSINFSWDNSYDFDNEILTYTFELASDYTFTDCITSQTDIIIPGASCPLLPDGQYFYRLTVTNESGQDQTALYYYTDINNVRHYGVAVFYVQDGQILMES
jgi:spore coat protein H